MRHSLLCHAPAVLFIWFISGTANGEWSQLTGSMQRARTGHTATLLDNGLVLVTGGWTDESGRPWGEDTSNKAELYDPQTGTWRYTGIGQQTFMACQQAGHTATKLSDGRVLLAGGIHHWQVNSGVGGTTTVATACAQLFDPVTETFTVTGSLNDVHIDHKSVLLNDGKVLVVGGTIEIYSPITGTWGVVSSGQGFGSDSALSLLSNGNVLVTGGGTTPSRVDMYNPASNTWSSMAPLLHNRRTHSASVLPNGKVLVVGGQDGTTIDFTAELYDVATNNGLGESVLLPDTLTVGPWHTAVPFPNGDVFVAGGANAQLYDFSAGRFVDLTPMLLSRTAFTATLLSSGQILISGGGGAAGRLRDAELRFTQTDTGGTINVTTNLDAASFTITGPETYNGSGKLYSQPNAPAGDYTITYEDVAGFKKPASETKNLAAGGTISFTGTYKPPLPQLVISPTALSFSTVAGVVTPLTRTLQVSSSGAVLQFNASASTTSGGNWLSVTPTVASTLRVLTVKMAPERPRAAVPVGTHVGAITIISTGADNSPIVIPVTLQVVAPGNLTLTPESGSSLVNTLYTLTATLTDAKGKPIRNKPITIRRSGAHPTGNVPKTTNAVGIAPYRYKATTVGADSVVATTTINGFTITSNTATVSWTLPPQPVTLDIVVPYIYPDPKGQPTPGTIALWQRVLELAAGERNRGGTRFSEENDKCYYPAMDATAGVAKKAILGMNNVLPAIVDASNSITPLLPLSAGGRILVGTTKFLIRVGTSEEPRVEALRFVTEKTIGYVLSRAASDYRNRIQDAIIDKVSRELVKTTLIPDGVVSTSSKGSNTGKRTSDLGLTNVEVGVWYNKFSHYITSGVRADCQLASGFETNFYTFQIEVDKDGLWVPGSARACNAAAGICKPVPDPKFTSQIE